MVFFVFLILMGQDPPPKKERNWGKGGVNTEN